MIDAANTKSKHALHGRCSNKVGIIENYSNDNVSSHTVVREEILSSETKEVQPIHLLAINGNKAELQEQIRYNKERLNEVDPLGRTPLIYSVLGDRVECSILLLKAGVDVNKADVDERTALHWASYQGNQKLVKLLLSKGADSSKRDKEGRTSLHLSMSHDNIKVMEVLLRYMNFGDINLHDNNKMTPLSWSVFYDRISYTRLLLKYGADASIMDKESRTVFHWASQNTDPNILKLLIEEIGTHINWPDSQGRTVLHLTVGHSNRTLVQYLLSISTIDINAKDGMERTPLHWAAVLGNAEIVSLLLESGADHTIIDNNGALALHYATQTDSYETVLAMLDKRDMKDVADNEHGTALMWAAVKGSDKVLEMLLAKKCSDVNAVDAHMQTALHKCTQAGHLQCVKILIKYDADVNVVDAKHHIPLFYACAAGHGDIVNELLSKGFSSNLDDKDEEGRCPIHYAAMVDRTDIIKILMRYNANSNSQDNAGCTPLHFASYLGFVHCMSVLLENGARINTQDNHGRTALHLACRSGSVDAVKLLSRFNASVNALAHEGEQLTPLDYAILGDHQDVAFYLQTEYNAYTAIALKYLSATKIQAVWRGYSFRNYFSMHKNLLIKHEVLRKGYAVSSQLSSDSFVTSLHNRKTKGSNCAYPLGEIIPVCDNTQNSNSRLASKTDDGFTYPHDIRFDCCAASCNTLSTKSSVFLINKSKSFENLATEKSIESNAISFKENRVHEKTGNTASKQMKGMQRVSGSVDVNYPVQLSKKNHKGSTHSLHSFSRFHQTNSPASSSSSSDLFTNGGAKKKESRNKLFNKTYGRYIIENKDVKSSSSGSSVRSNPRPKKIAVCNAETKWIDVQEGSKVTINLNEDKTSKVLTVDPDVDTNQPWNIYRREQRRINIIREKTKAASKIQLAFRRYYKNKYPNKQTENGKSIKIEAVIRDLSGNNVILSSKNHEKMNGDILKEHYFGDLTCQYIADSKNLENISIKNNASKIAGKQSSSNSPANPEKMDKDVHNDQNSNDSSVKEVAALLIQLAWRQYLKNKLLKEQSHELSISNHSDSFSYSPKSCYQQQYGDETENDELSKLKSYSRCSDRKSGKNRKYKSPSLSFSFIQEVYLPGTTHIFPGKNSYNKSNGIINNLKSSTHCDSSTQNYVPSRNNSSKSRSSAHEGYM